MVCEASQHYSRRWYPSLSTRMAQFDTLYAEGTKTCVSYEPCSRIVHSGEHVVNIYVAQILSHRGRCQVKFMTLLELSGVIVSPARRSSV